MQGKTRDKPLQSKYMNSKAVKLSTKLFFVTRFDVKIVEKMMGIYHKLNNNL